MRATRFLTLTGVTTLLLGFGVPSHSVGSVAEDQSVSTPLRLVGEHSFIRLTVNDSEPLHFIFDTGAGTTVLNRSTSERLGLQSDRRSSASGAASSIEVDRIRDVEIRVGEMSLGEVDVQSIDLSHLERSLGMRIDGIVGFHLLRRNVVEVNYDTSELKVHPRGYRYAGPGTRIRLKRTRHVSISAKLDIPGRDPIDARFLLDTGAGIAIGMSTPFVTRNDLIDVLNATFVSSSKGLTDTAATIRRSRVPRLDFEGFSFENVPASLYDVEQGFFSERRYAGVIGNPVLKRFNIVFDYGRRQSWWMPNERFKTERFLVNGSGLSLETDDSFERVFVSKVHPDSPAAQVGLAVGDEIISIDELNVANTPLSELESLLERDGAVIRLTCARDGESVSTELTLKAPY